MNVEQAIRTKLLTIEALAALVGDRVRPEVDPDDPLPFVLYSEADRVRLETLDGYLDTGSYSMDLEIYAASRSEAKAVAKTFLKPAGDGGILGFAGPLPGGVGVQDVTVEGESSEYLAPSDGGSDGIHLYSLTLVVWQSGGE